MKVNQFGRVRIVHIGGVEFVPFILSHFLNLEVESPQVVFRQTLLRLSSHPLHTTELSQIKGIQICQ